MGNRIVSIAWTTNVTPIDTTRTAVLGIKHDARCLPTRRMRLLASTFEGTDGMTTPTVSLLPTGCTRPSCNTVSPLSAALTVSSGIVSRDKRILAFPRRLTPSLALIALTSETVYRA